MVDFFKELSEVLLLFAFLHGYTFVFFSFKTQYNKHISPVCRNQTGLSSL